MKGNQSNGALPPMPRNGKNSTGPIINILRTLSRHMADSAADMMAKVRAKRPLVHHITNYVTVNDCANVCICAGGSPVMTDEVRDIPEMVALASAVVLNIGTLNERVLESMAVAGREANRNDVPVILDPVGVGATSYRTAAVRKLMETVEISVIKGNVGEIGVLSGLGGEVRGVDSVSGSDDVEASVSSLAKRTGAVVAATGEADYVSDGKSLAVLRNGSTMLEKVSGTGCMVSSVAGCYAGACGASLESVSAAISVFNIASEKAMGSGKVFGPASFKTKLLDSLHGLSEEDVDESLKMEKGRI